MTHLLYTLLGAALLALGVLAAAFADRIRGIRLQREHVEFHAASTPRASRAPIEVVEAELVTSRESKPKPEPKARAMADDVIAALVASGYKKPVAAEATWSCTAAERATIENWTRAALRAAAKGAAS